MLGFRGGSKWLNFCPTEFWGLPTLPIWANPEFLSFGPGMVGSSGARLGRETRSQTGAPILNNIFSAGPNFDPNPDITHFNMWSCEVVNTNTAQFKVAFLRSVTVSLHCSEMSKYPVLVTKWWPTIHHQSCCVGWGCVLCYYQIKRFQTTNTTNIYFSRENGWKIFPHFSILALPRCQSQPATFP